MEAASSVTNHSECFQSHLLGSGVAFVQQMFDIDDKVKSAGGPNFMGAKVPVPSNLHLSQWRCIASTVAQHQEVDFLTFGFPSRFEGVIPPPLTPVICQLRSTLVRWPLTSAWNVVMVPRWGHLIVHPLFPGVRLVL